ncbi:MAG: NnrS family protein, partial [Gammaproteobacteria bacterium]
MNLEKDTASGIPLFRLAFRPFFLGAGVYSVLAIIVWMAVTVFDKSFVMDVWPPAIWHAHEMLFGYGLAVVAGFLLTAIKNWTGVQTIRGAWLFVLVSLWAITRLIPLIDTGHAIKLMAVFDVLFMLMFIMAATIPVIKAKQYTQAGIISKLVLLLVSNLLFYLGALGYIADGVRWGLYSGLYILIALVLVMARRVIPFFIEKGTESGVTVRNWQWIDITSLVLLLLLWILDVFTEYRF